MRIGLVGCVKSKWIHPSPAQDLYISTLFKGRRSFVERSCDRWFVLSAKHGLVDPLEIIAPYDVALTKKSNSYRVDWSRKVIRQLQEEIGDLSSVVFEIHAGAAYRNYGVVEGLVELGAVVEAPNGEYRFGELLAFYSDADREQSTLIPRSITDGQPRGIRGRRRVGYEVIAEYLNATNVEELLVTFEEIEELMDRPLPQSASTYGVWWANSKTNPQSRHWVSAGWKVHHIRVEDREVHFRRNLARSTKPKSKAWIDSANPKQEPWMKLVEEITDRPVPRASLPVAEVDHKAIIDAMLKYGTRLEAKSKRDGVSYTHDPAANDFLIANAFAFLVGVIFDQGIPAERAWAAPHELKKRLGHLDPVRLCSEQEEILQAIQQRPKLHRFINNIPEWVSLAAEQVVRRYEGDASNIWGDNPTAVELTRRLTAFKGIGQKKAAMAVELLARDLGVHVRDLAGGDVAFDVHIRRVFLRTGLSDVDRVDHVVRSGRENHPEHPGSLDGPAWNIGRNWCRPNYPTCPACILDEVCPKYISRGSEVKGF